jgi:hypothetical protein
MFSFLCLALYCALFPLVIQLRTLQDFHTTCSFLSDIKSIDSDRNPISDFVNLLVHVSKFQVLPSYTMPVVTRSMSKVHAKSNDNLSIAPSSLSSDQVTTLDNFSPLISSTIVASPVPSLSDCSSPLVRLGEQFEISNCINMEFSNFYCPGTTVHTDLHSQNFPMESECNQNDSTLKAEPDPPYLSSPNDDKIMNLLVVISNQMMANTQDLQNQILWNHQDLQEQLIQNDLKFTTEIQRLSQDYETFKQQSRAALISLQSTPLPPSVPQVSALRPITSSSTGGSPVDNNTGSSLHLPMSTPPQSTVNTMSSLPSATVGNDMFQNQMLQMLNEMFSKLSTVITDTKASAKSEWPKFSGDVSKFKDWYLAIMAQISLPPWTPLYYPVKNDIVSSTSETSLNGQLYAKLLVCLEGQAMKNMISGKHLRANGILLLRNYIICISQKMFLR